MSRISWAVVVAFVALHSFVKWRTRPGAEVAPHEVQPFTASTTEGDTFDFGTYVKSHRFTVVTFAEFRRPSDDKEFDEPEQIFKNYGSQNVGALVVYRLTDPSTMQRIPSALNLHVPVVHDETGAIGEDFGIDFAPTTVVVDNTFHVVHSKEGMDDDLEPFLNDALAHAPGPKP